MPSQDVTADQLQVNIIQAENALIRMGEILKNAGDRSEFMSLIQFVEQQMLELKAGVIRNSRAHKKGIRKDGAPDRRFGATVKSTDLRFSR